MCMKKRKKNRFVYSDHVVTHITTWEDPYLIISYKNMDLHHIYVHEAHLVI